MKKNLRSVCLLILVFLFFIAGFAGMGSADRDTNQITNTSKETFNYSNVNHHTMWGKQVNLPTTDYPIWGYPDKSYNFFVNCTISPEDYSTTTVVFYWDCLNNSSDLDYFPPNNSGNLVNSTVNDTDAKTITLNCTHKWNNTGIYSVAVGIFKSNNSGRWDGKGVSYWVPVEIRNNTYITVQSFSMLDEKEGFDRKNSAQVCYKISNFSEIMLDGEEEFNCSNSTYKVLSLNNSSENRSYCGYKDTDYSFSTCLNATCRKSEGSKILPDTRRPLTASDTSTDRSLTANDTTNDTTENLSETDTRTIGETTTVIIWGDNSSDNSIFGTISNEKVLSDNNAYLISDNKSDNSTAYIQWNENFTHEWDDTGIKNINARTFHWDPFDGSEDYSNSSNKSVLIIQDPKHFFLPFIGIPFNLHNWGIFLSIIGLIIFYFTYTRNNVPIEISIFGMKPFYLKSVNSLTGTLIFVAGMYLYFVFGRCPWDIPIVSSMDRLSNMYFNMLYHEYETKQHFGVPYLSILIGMLDVIILSLIIHLIAIPFYKGEFKIGEFLRRKLSSTSAQPELVSNSVENKINQDN